MPPETLFSLANGLALPGWVALLLAPAWRPANWWLAGIGLPALLAAL